mgnify:CR=1 FL=1
MWRGFEFYKASKVLESKVVRRCHAMLSYHVKINVKILGINGVLWCYQACYVELSQVQYICGSYLLGGIMQCRPSFHYISPSIHSAWNKKCLQRDKLTNTNALSGHIIVTCYYKGDIIIHVSSFDMFFTPSLQQSIRMMTYRGLNLFFLI